MFSFSMVNLLICPTSRWCYICSIMTPVHDDLTLTLSNFFYIKFANLNDFYANDPLNLKSRNCLALKFKHYKKLIN